jgi:hypothetical protein
MSYEEMSRKELMEEINVLEHRLAKANALCIKLAHQKGGQVDEMRELKARLAEAEKECDSLKEKLECFDYPKSYHDLADSLVSIELTNKANKAIADERGFRLRAASELVKKWRGYKLETEGFKTIRIEPTKEELRCADELEAALGEAKN